MENKGIGPNKLGAVKSPAKKTDKPKKVSEKDSSKISEGSAFTDGLKEKRAKKAEQHGDPGRAQRIRSTKNTQSNIG